MHPASAPGSPYTAFSVLSSPSLSGACKHAHTSQGHTHMAPAPGSHTQKTMWVPRCILSLKRRQAPLLSQVESGKCMQVHVTHACIAMQWGTGIRITVGTVTSEGTGLRGHRNTETHTCTPPDHHTCTPARTQTPKPSHPQTPAQVPSQALTPSPSPTPFQKQVGRAEV